MYKFTPRLTAPLSTNSFYYSNLNVYYASGYGMPNCTAYAYGRVLELASLNGVYADFQGFAGNGGTWGDAGYIGNNWTKSNTPKLGSIAVFTQAGHDGHVAVVEEIHDDGTVTTSNSAWKGTNFWTDRINVKSYGTYNFKYYLYPPYIDGETPTPPAPSKTKKRRFKFVLYARKLRKEY